MSFVPAPLFPLRPLQSPDTDRPQAWPFSFPLLAVLSVRCQPPLHPQLSPAQEPLGTRVDPPTPEMGPVSAQGCAALWVGLGCLGPALGLLVTSYLLLQPGVLRGRSEGGHPSRVWVCLLGAGGGWRALALGLPERVPGFSPQPTPPPVLGKSNFPCPPG